LQDFFMNPKTMNHQPKTNISDSGGTGPALVFLHGFCESKAIWQDFVAPLPADYRVILLDLPGFGANNAPQEDYSMESGAAAVQQVLADLQLEKSLVIGHSMGGYVALALAEKYPQLLAGLVLFHSSALADSEEKKDNRNKTIAFIRKQGVDKFMDTFVAPLFYEGNRQAKKEVIALLTQIGKQSSEQAIVGALAGMRDRPDRSQVLQAADFPVMIIAGKQDPAVALEQTLQQCHLPGESHTLFLDQTGHMGMFEKTRETRLALQGFAGRCFASTARQESPDMRG
jgi:pimeloyl-ACP methyl ester carboxylesterase